MTLLQTKQQIQALACGNLLELCHHRHNIVIPFSQLKKEAHFNFEKLFRLIK